MKLKLTHNVAKPCQYFISPRLSVCLNYDLYDILDDTYKRNRARQGILKGGSITVLLTSCLTGLESGV
jgi:hypothetical protein